MRGEVGIAKSKFRVRGETVRSPDALHVWEAPLTQTSSREERGEGVITVLCGAAGPAIRRGRATISPVASISSASASADRSSCDSRRPIAVNGPSAAGLTKVVSSRVVRRGPVRGQARHHGVAGRSPKASSMPPCTVPWRLANCGSARKRKRTSPDLVSTEITSRPSRARRAVSLSDDPTLTSSRFARE